MNSTIATPFRIVLLFGAICLTGVWMLPLFQVELLPKENTAALTVSFSLPGAAPEIVEQEMTSVLEGACSQLDQLKQIRSVSGRNYGNVQLVFDKSADIPFKIIELAALIRRLRPQFPPDASYPLIPEGSGQPERPAMVYVVYTPGASMSVSPESELMIRSALSGIEDIDEIDVGAGGSRQLVIDFDLARCLAFGVDPQRIVAAVQSFFSPAHPGSFSIGGQTKFIRIAVPDAAPEVLEHLHVPTPGNLIRLKDVANVSFEEVSGSGKTRINGRNLVRISIYPRKAANRLVLGEAVRKAMIALKDRLPEQLDTEAEYDDTALLKKELHAHYWRISLSVLLLSCLILLLYRSWRYWSIVMFALLASFSITLVVNGMLRIPVHLYTLAAASVAFGLLADNLVVMLEYYRKQGKKAASFHWRALPAQRSPRFH
ncbi:efflux RND transporter permease subunit [Chitinophaga sedimenti]|uniref:efflux RND transporter permease subunit n=1 Tax=Chitinophaga sedimenti TaxID=2033606 RepID=UPI0020063D17|nr:efflux RND transporter permease subunit [Chitinophaga sedimenti]MCK7556207.1 efflux RND transporter permease subunit [Chitinophaga sedimenti]